MREQLAAQGNQRQGRIAVGIPRNPGGNNCNGKMSGCSERWRISGVRSPNAINRSRMPRSRSRTWNGNWRCGSGTPRTLPSHVPLTDWPASRGCAAASTRANGDRAASPVTRASSATASDSRSECRRGAAAETMRAQRAKPAANARQGDYGGRTAAASGDRSAAGAGAHHRVSAPPCGLRTLRKNHPSTWREEIRGNFGPQSTALIAY